MLTQSMGGPAPGPTLLTTEVWFLIASPSWASRKSPNSFHLIVSPIVISPAMVKTLSLHALMSSSWAASLQEQHVVTDCEIWASFGTLTAAKAAETAPALANCYYSYPAPTWISPALQSHHAKSTDGIPTSGAVRLQSRSYPIDKPDPTWANLPFPSFYLRLAYPETTQTYPRRAAKTKVWVFI
jgi:hypothetical protein